MTTILAIDSSASGEGSVSKVLVQDALKALQQAHPGAKTIYHDLGRAPLPHITEANLAGIRGEPRSQDELATRALSDRLIAELKSADIILIGAPMYNFSMPTTLRAWFDHVLRAGETFSYSETGPKGLVTGKRVIVIESRGGFYSDGPTKALDFQEPYMRQLLGFIGLTDVTFVHAEKIGFGPDAKAAAIAGALSSLSKLTQAA